MHLTNLVVEHIGYGQFNGVTKTMLMNWKKMYIEKKQVLPDVLWKPSVVLHILSRDKYDITTKSGVSGHLFPGRHLPGGRLLRYPA